MQTFTFGKYNGRRISDPDIDPSYLIWLRDQRAQDVADLNAEITRREQEADGDLTWVERIVQVGFRALAQQHHPDHGGDGDKMRELLGAKTELDRTLDEIRALTEGRKPPRQAAM